MILCMTPFAPDLNLGRAYDLAMARLGPDDWAVFLDHDAMWTTTKWYSQIADAIARQPEGSFTAVSNRMASPWQVAPEGKSFAPKDDIRLHRDVGTNRLANTNLLDVTESNGWGGVVMVLSKRNWEKVGGFEDGLLCVDHIMHYALRRAGLKVYCIEGLYVYHFRGTSGSEAWKSMPMAKDPRTGQPCPHRYIP